MADETAPKLKPIIVTQKKIISLKKKSETEPSNVAKSTKSITIERKIPTATVLPESKRLAVEQSTMATSATTAIVKPVIKKSILLKSSKSSTNEIDDDIDEDKLLADSPSPPLSPVKMLRTKAPITASSSTNSSKSLFTNRRVIVRETTGIATTSNDDDGGEKTSTHPSAPKGIFDRLEKKVIGLNEAAKRKIQRIVIKNTE